MSSPSAAQPAAQPLSPPPPNTPSQEPVEVEKSSARPRSYSPPRHEHPSSAYPKRATSPRLIITGVLVALAVVLAGLQYIGAATPLGRSMTTLLPGPAAQELSVAHEIHTRGEAALDTRTESGMTEDEEALLASAVEAILHEQSTPPVLHLDANFAEPRLIQDLPREYIPVPANVGRKDIDTSITHKKRLIVVGDIHGMLPELEDLLAKLNFDTKNDHLVCAGDMISKGPDSVGVVQLLMKIGASAVRGNHEDRVLLAEKGRRRKAVKLAPESLQRPILASDPVEEQMSSSDTELDAALSDMKTFSRSKEYKDRVLAAQFSAAQLAWLKALPVILRVGPVDGLGTVVVVHGGLVPGLRLEKQDPYAVMNMRTIDLKTRVPSEGHRGVGWTKLFNRWQERIAGLAKGGGEGRMTVLYGHDSRRGLAIGEYTKGLDSGCLKGGRLTAFVMEGGMRHVETGLVSVRCRDMKV